MKKKIIQLVVLIGVLVLLLVGYLVVIATTTEVDSTVDNAAVTDLTYNVATVDQKTVHKISYTVGSTEYAFTLKEDATGWVWNDDPTLPLDNLYFANIVTAFTSLTSTVRLADVTPTQLMDYGLGEDAQRVSFTDLVNGARSYRIGKYNNFNGMLYFCDESDLTTVYMVPSTVTDSLIYLPYDMIKLPDLPTDITTAKILRVTLTPSTHTGEPAVYTYYVGGKVEDEKDVWYGAPYAGAEEIRLSDEDGKALSQALTTLAFSELVSYKADEQAALGFDFPWTLTIFYKVTQSFQDSTTGKTTSVDVDRSFTLLLGDVNEKGLCYATVERSPLTCTLMGDIFAKLLDGSLLKTE